MHTLYTCTWYIYICIGLTQLNPLQAGINGLIGAYILYIYMLYIYICMSAAYTVHASPASG